MLFRHADDFGMSLQRYHRPGDMFLIKYLLRHSPATIHRGKVLAEEVGEEDLG